MQYLKAVLKKDNEKKISQLKRLIYLGKKLKKDTRPDEKKLDILLKRNKKKNFVKTSNSSSIFIKNINLEDGNIVVRYNQNISSDFVKFFELKRPNFYRDVYDLKGNYPKAKRTKIKIKNVDKVTIGQFKPYTLRIVLSNKTNLKSSYFIKDNKIIISPNSKIKNIKNIKKIEKTKKINKENSKYIDRKNFIRNIKIEDNTIRVIFNGKFSKKKLKYFTYKHNGKYEDIFYIDGKYAYASPIKLKIKGFERIIVSQIKKKLRIKLIDRKNYKVVYKIKNQELVIKILDLDKKREKSLPYPNFKPKTIVIDAGHGAHDVGAVGPHKRYEKVVTLKVAKYLYYLLKKRGHRVYLTRTKDKFIKVMHRTILANKKNADIFVSIHANSVPKNKAHKIKGIETFFLSPARSSRAKRVAAKENKTDIRRMSNSTKQAFLESLNRPRITASHKLAIDVQAGILQSVKSKYSGIVDSGVREGPFWVLVGAQMPSILVEIGYISHPIESKRLYSSKYQKLLASGIANGVDSYFSKNP
ncbi:MAG: N-acetylmuramoyl-L-alanine amidase [Arcobacter sp.]|nr:N-acetylmuramoyl-L-alanine amidase [Arcobacter sp.]